MKMMLDTYSRGRYRKAMLEMDRGMIARTLTPRQLEYATAVFVECKTVQQAALDFGVATSSISRSIDSAMRKLDKLIKSEK